MNSYEQNLNYFFVRTFNRILSWEEQSMRASGLENVSVRELHIIEATHMLQLDKASTMSRIAERLNISVGALTTAVNALVRKGYLYRGGDDKDRRKVYIYLTDKGADAFEIHERFHKDMIGEITDMLDENSIRTLAISLNRLSEFFDDKIKE